MILFAFNLAIWTVVFFIVGMIKPQWPLFFMKKPDRFIILVVTTILVMITFTLYGEGRKERDLEEKAKKPAFESSQPVQIPVPVPVPVPDTGSAVKK
jgi:hypothetical protein